MMGAYRSKIFSGKCSPDEEKHASADSTTPLAREASRMNLNRVSAGTDRASENLRRTISRPKTLSSSFDDTTLAESPTSLSAATSFLDPRPSPTPTASNSHNLSTQDFQGHANVTLPAPPPPIRRLSELIDVATLPVDEVVRSPSGRLLPVEDFLVHPDRPRSMRERQEEIREKLEGVRGRSRLGMVDGVDEKGDHAINAPESPKKKRGKWNCFSCCC